MLTVVVGDDLADSWTLELEREVISKAVFSLNKVAKKASESVREDMGSRFTLRGGWIKKGIRFEKANAENLIARVYSLDDYMVKQEEGQTYRPDGHVAIPSAARRTPNSPIARSMLPKNLRGRKDVFKFDFSTNAAYRPYPLEGIFQRFGGPKGNKYFRVLYLLKDKKNTKPLWQFTPQVEKIFDQLFDQYFYDGELDSFDPSRAGWVGGAPD